MGGWFVGGMDGGGGDTDGDVGALRIVFWMFFGYVWRGVGAVGKGYCGARLGRCGEGHVRMWEEYEASRGREG